MPQPGSLFGQLLVTRKERIAAQSGDASPAPDAGKKAPISEVSAMPGKLAQGSSAPLAGSDSPAARGGLGSGAATVESLIPGVPDIPDIPDVGIICRIKVTNQTDQVLKLDKASIKIQSGRFSTDPPDTIDKNDDADFRAVNKIPFLAGAEGQLEYVLDDQDTRWFIRWENARVDLPNDENEAPSHVTGPNAAKFKVKSKAGPNKKDDFTYVLSPAGGAKPSPQPQPSPGNDSVQSSCRVSIVNQTQETIFLRKQDKTSGDYVTNPSTSLAPGATSQFVFEQTPGSKDPACQGNLSWDIGDPAKAVWELMWNNPKGTKNTSSGEVKPDGIGFHSLDQIDQGDENVPVTFTLSGGGKPQPQPQPSGHPVSCAIVVKNDTDAVLTLAGVAAENGSFGKAPPQTIAAGESIQIAYSGAPPGDPSKGAKGSMQWAWGEPKATTWRLEWNNPPGDGNTAIADFSPEVKGLTSDAATAPAGDENVPMTFTLTGHFQPPAPADDDFAPPPKSKQPTLRIKDESPDGWVEYAQQLLQRHGEQGPFKTGTFDGTMKSAVEHFQSTHGCVPDGVIGNQTWSALRDAPTRDPFSTDGRKPHTFEEKGAQGRFFLEHPDSFVYSSDDDDMIVVTISTGEQPIDKFKMTLKFTQPDGTAHAHAAEIGDQHSSDEGGQGEMYFTTIKGVTKRFGLKSGVKPDDCTIDAYLDAAIGGDRFTGKIKKVM